MRRIRFGQKSKTKTFLFSKPPPVKHTCLLCLEEMSTKQRIKYSTNICKCNPRIHDTCFNQWNKQYPGSCPICRKEGTIYMEHNPEIKSVPVVSNRSDHDTGLGCILGCWSVMNCIDVFSS